MNILTIDFDKLNHIALTIPCDYLIMNERTLDFLSKNCGISTVDTAIEKYSHGYVSVYRGIPIALCNQLSLGEIEAVKKV